MPDVAVVGGGPAGVATAYFLRDSGADVIVLEAGDDVGGRTRSVDVAGVPSCTGALFVYRGTPAEELATELGVRTVAFTPATYGVHVGGVTVVDGDNDRLIDRLPIPSTAREQLRAFVRTSLAEYARYTRGGRLTDDAGELGGRTLAERLHGLDPEVQEIITRAIRGGSVADPSRLSAQYALRYFASYLAHEQDNRLYPVDGMQSLVRAMAAKLEAGTVRRHARVDRIARDGDGDGDSYALTVAGDAAPVRARHVVVAVPAPITRQIVADLPAWKDEALAAAEVPGSTTLCVTADVTGLPHLARWAFVTTTGRAFDAIINPRPVGPGAEPPTVAQFVCYGNTAGHRPDLATPAGAAAWVEEFLAVAPELRGRVLGAHLATWEHCFAILTPERARAVPRLQESVGGLHFAGDHTSASAGTHGAYGEARRVADLIRAELVVGAS